MVGGRLIEISYLGDCIVRLWCVGSQSGELFDECCVHAEVPYDGVMPALGDEIWWQSGKIYFDGDKRYLVKVGNSYSPQPSNYY